MRKGRPDVGAERWTLFGDESAPDVLIQPEDAQRLGQLAHEAELIRALAPGRPFALAALPVGDWNTELSPWEAPPVFGNEAFGSGAADTLVRIERELIPALGEGRRYWLGGYSLAGLFSLWAAYRTARLAGVAAVSPSVWFPDWDRFIREERCLAPRVYLSLGDREAKTRNTVMAQVAGRIRLQAEVLSGGIDCVLEWNAGNHFAEPELRTAKGFAWLLSGREHTDTPPRGGRLDKGECR